jgi:hypothetical protein
VLVEVTIWFPEGSTTYQFPPKALTPSPFVSPAFSSPENV